MKNFLQKSDDTAPTFFGFLWKYTWCLLSFLLGLLSFLILIALGIYWFKAIIDQRNRLKGPPVPTTPTTTQRTTPKTTTKTTPKATSKATPSTPKPTTAPPPTTTTAPSTTTPSPEEEIDLEVETTAKKRKLKRKKKFFYT